MSTGMRRKGTCAAATLSVAGAIFLSTSGPISAAEDTRAIPDFFMNGFGWHSRQANIMPPPPGTPGVRGPIRDHPDHPHVANNSGGLPTVRIGDDINPLLFAT